MNDNGEQQITEVSYSDYHYSRDPEQAANKLMSALPDFASMTTRSICEKLHSVPKELNDCANRIQRSAFLMELASSAFFPLARHLQIHSLITIMIKLGYKNRSIYEDEREIPAVEEIIKHNNSGELKVYKRAQSCLSAAIIGCSGIGKSYAVEQILGLFKQCLRHKVPFSDETGITEKEVIQVVYLKVDCPPDGNVKVLFTRIITELGKLVDHKYSEGFENSKRITLEILMARALTLMERHKVGILVIDEIQNLVHHRQNHEVLFNFLVSLSNTLKIPVLYIGTPKAMEFFQNNLRIARRFASCGVYVWDRLKSGNNGSPGEWEEFISSMWAHSILKKDPLSIPREINDTLYDCSQGIIDVLLKLFVLSEMRALELGLETLTSPVITTVYEDHFKTVAPMIKALKSNDIREIQKYQDLMISGNDFVIAAETMRSNIQKNSNEVVEEAGVTQEDLLAECISIAEACNYDLNNKNLRDMLLLKVREQIGNDEKEVITNLYEIMDQLEEHKNNVKQNTEKSKDKKLSRTVGTKEELPIEEVSSSNNSN